MMNSSAKAQKALLNTLQEIQDRTEVEECLRDMLIDVELSLQLKERLESRQQIHCLQQRILEQDHVIEEARVVRNETIRQQVSMADALLSELLSLSAELGTLKEIKQRHDELLVQYDEVVAKLLHAEENAQVEMEHRSRDEEASTSYQPADELTSAGETLEAPLELNDGLKGNPGVASSLQEPPDIVRESTEVNAVDAIPPPLLQTESIDDGPERVALVTLDDDVEPSIPTPVPRLDEMEMEIIMKIFSYLDALDILSTAQINVSMYSRVDSFFDFGTGNAEDEEPAVVEATNPTAQPPSIPSTITTTTTLVSLPTSIPPVDTSIPSGSSDNATPSTVANPGILQPTLVELPPAPAKTSNAAVVNSTSGIASSNTAAASPKHVPSKSNDSAILNRGIFSLLQPRRLNTGGATTANGGNAATTAPLSPVPSPTRNFLRPSVGDAASIAAAPLTMNAAMANSMAAKLSDTELNAIILMTERLKVKETLADKLTKENEALVAKLDGTEGVKQFLINKVREMEGSLSALLQNEMKVAQQIASDQEVIAFLDARVQELERTMQGVRNEKQAALEELERMQKQTTQKVSVMEDMLQFEREKLSDQEREWKVTKKLLVKEVKNCRAQIIALQAERDGCREQNETLRRAISNNSSSNGTMHSRDRAYA
jgi:hypothetical protein